MRAILRQTLRQNVLYLGLLVLLLAIGGFIWVASSRGDIVLFLYEHRTPFFNRFFSLGTHLGDGYFILVVVMLLLLVRFKLFLQVGLTCLLTGIVVFILKHGLFPDVFRPGPFLESMGNPIEPVDGARLLQRYSFPSGHSAGAVALFTALALNLRWQGLQLLCLLAAIEAMISRIYLGHHFLGDVVTGATISLILALLIYSWIYSSKWFEKPVWDQSLLTVWSRQRTG